MNYWCPMCQVRPQQGAEIISSKFHLYCLQSMKQARNRSELVIVQKEKRLKNGII